MGLLAIGGSWAVERRWWRVDKTPPLCGREVLSFYRQEIA
jgi:hypothetical protein